MKWTKKKNEEYTSGVFTIEPHEDIRWKWWLDNGNPGTCNNLFETLSEAQAYAEQLEADYQKRLEDWTEVEA